MVSIQGLPAFLNYESLKCAAWLSLTLFFYFHCSAYNGTEHEVKKEGEEKFTFYVREEVERRRIMSRGGFRRSPRSKVQWKIQKGGWEAISLHSFWTDVFYTRRLLLYPALQGWRKSLQNLLGHLLLFMEFVMELGVGLPLKDKGFFVDSKSLWNSSYVFIPWKALGLTLCPKYSWWSRGGWLVIQILSALGPQLKLMKETFSAVMELPIQWEWWWHSATECPLTRSRSD